MDKGSVGDKNNTLYRFRPTNIFFCLSLFIIVYNLILIDKNETYQAKIEQTDQIFHFSNSPYEFSAFSKPRFDIKNVLQNIKFNQKTEFCGGQFAQAQIILQP